MNGPAGEAPSAEFPGATRLRNLLVGPHVGIVQSLEAVSPEHDDVPICYYAGRLANTAALGGGAAVSAISGAATTNHAALAACLGEAAERYAAAFVPPRSIHLAPAAHWGQQAISPDRFASFGAAQYRSPKQRFPFRPWFCDDTIGWFAGQSLCDNREVWLPAALVFLPYRFLPGEPFFAPGLSTGLACGCTMEDATMRALCEVVERDAVALAWLGLEAPPRLELAGVEAVPELANLLGVMDAAGLRPWLVDVSTDLELPVVVAMLRGRSPVGNVISLGSACHPLREAAVIKALVEAAHCRVYVKSMMRAAPGWRGGRQFELVTSFADHARYYSLHPERSAAVMRWIRGHGRVVWNLADRPSTGGSNLRTIAGSMHAKGYEAFACQLTTPDLMDAGLAVARVLIPQLQPLHGNHHWPHLGGPRLRMLQRVFGPHARLRSSLNKDPHPFA